MNRFKRAFRRWLFRRIWPDYKVSTVLPADGQTVVVLDVEHKHPVWLAEYNAVYDSYTADGGWFEANEITYWTPIKGAEDRTANE